MVITTLFTFAKILETTEMPIDGRMDKQNVVRIYNTIKRKEGLTHATLGMNLVDMMLSEIIHSQKTNNI